MKFHSSVRKGRLVELRIKGPVLRVETEAGSLFASLLNSTPVGDRLVPAQIEAWFPGGESGQPSLHMLIEVVGGVPRCTELSLKKKDGGREIRPKDLRTIELETWIEAFVARVSSVIEDNEDGRISASYGPMDERELRKGMKQIAVARRGSRRPMTAERRKRVAEIYNAQETGGIEAVELAFNVSRSTAVRYINAAREAGLIAGRAR